jgi:hypothetical protein
LDAYYLLTYAPTSTIKGGTFKRTTVRVKGRPYKVLCRQGYTAD